MRRAATRALALFAAFTLLAAGECTIGSLGEILDAPGQIVVTNVGTEPAVLAIIADDVKSYPSLAAGATSSAQTNVGGRYTVSVTMSPEAALEYRAELQELRRTVEKLVDGTASTQEKTYAFISLAGIKAAIQRFESGSGASCSGNIKLDADDKVTVNATVNWVTQSGSGFWDLTCGSS